MTSYFNACDVTIANTNYKNFPYFFEVHLRPHFEKGASITDKTYTSKNWFCFCLLLFHSLSNPRLLFGGTGF